MNRLRPAVVSILLSGSAALALAAEPSLLKSASDAVSAAVNDIATAAEDAASAAQNELSGPEKKRKRAQTAKKAAKDALPDGSKAAGPAAGETKSAPSATDQTISEPANATATGSRPDAKTHTNTNTRATGKLDAPQNSSSAPAAAQKGNATGAPNAATGSPTAPANEQRAAPTEAPETKGAHPPELTEWPALEIELARARCTRLLKDVDAVTAPEAPFRKGECGSAAPVRLVSIGKNPPIAISPPALVSCDMVVALHAWIKEHLKPLAKKHLGADVAKIQTMSDYSCRHAYGRIGNRLSEHGRANALDIRGFVTTKGKTAYVLEEWGRTQRDIAAELAAKAAAETAEAERLEAERAAREHNGAQNKVTAAPPAKIIRVPPAGASASSGATAGGPSVKTTIIEGMPKPTATLSAAEGGRSSVRSDAAHYIREAPRRLGGPKPGAAGSQDRGLRTSISAGPDAKAGAPLPAVTAGAVPVQPVTATGRFLREAHRAACRIFGTTLGPEANEDHRNHFHVDMAERKLTKVCD